MNYLIIWFLIASPVGDSLSENHIHKGKSYANQTFLCGLISGGFGIAAVACNVQSDKYYDSYRMRTTIGGATNDWNRVVYYADMRNVCVVSAVIFLIPTVYFEIKHLSSRRELSQKPFLDLRYCDDKIYVLLKKTL